MDCFKVLFSILIVSFGFSSASFFKRQFDGEPLHRHKRAASCHLTDGQTIPDGGNFTQPALSGPCVSYVCRDGSVFPLDYGCYRDGRCYALNHVWRFGCIERTCQLFKGRFEYIISKEACTGQTNDTCVDVGTTLKEGCITYACDKEQVSPNSVAYHLRQAQVGCEYKGRCIGENQNVTQGCRTITCQKRYGAVGFQTTSNGCDIEGRCVAVGQTVTTNCRTFACTQEKVNGFDVLNIKPVKIQCKDSDDACHDSGSYFPIDVNSKRANCTCSVQGLTVEYSCNSV